MKVYGYARVSTSEQHLDRQIAALEEHGIPANQIYVDKMSGKGAGRINSAGHTACARRNRSAGICAIGIDPRAPNSPKLKLTSFQQGKIMYN